MKTLIFAFAFIIISVLSAFTQNVNGLIISDSANLTVLKIWGTHEERGIAYGYLLGEQISDLATGYMIPLFGPYWDDARQMIIDGEDLSIDSLFIQEAMAVIDGMNEAGTNNGNIDYIDMLVANSFIDVLKILGLTAEVPGCSSLMNWGDATLGTDLDGKSVISRHFDYDPHPSLINNQVLVVHFPSKVDEQPWVMVGFAGQICALSGFNQNLGVFLHMMSDYYRPSNSGVGFEPIQFTLRKTIEKLDFNNNGVNDTQDVRDAISENTMGTADGYIISALAPSTSGSDSLTALVAELSPQAPFITFRNNSYLDLIPGDNLYTANFQIKRNNQNNYCWRYNAVMGAIGSGTEIGSIENWQIMQDHSSQGSINIQFMQFIPENDIFKISVHRDGSPAYMHPPTTFFISDLLYLPVGISSIATNSGLKIFPNPANDYLFIKQPSLCTGGEYRIYSIKGNVVLKGQIMTEQKPIDVRNLSEGVYFLQLDNRSTLKFIKT